MTKELENFDVENVNKNGLHSAFAGIGGGTLFVFLTENLPNGSPLKPILEYFAPCITFLITFISHEIQRRYNDAIRRKKQTYSLAIADRFLNDPTISEEHREKIRLLKEQIQLNYLNQEMYAQRNK